MGTIYKKKGSDYWYLNYRYKGRRIRESANTTVKAIAEQRLKILEGDIAKGKIPSVCFEKITFEDLAADLVDDFEVNSHKTIGKIRGMLRLHLQPFFGGMPVTEITSDKIQRYVRQRLSAGATNGTINRELTALKRMMNLGARQTPPKVDRVPVIKMLKENNVRKGFFEAEEFARLLPVLPDYLQPLCIFGYRTGWRFKEITSLTWDRVDLKVGVVRLEPGETKSGEGRTLYLDSELKELLKEQLSQRRLGCPFVFHRDGLEIKNYYKSWRKACADAGLAGKLFHDFRRTAVRNMIRAGVPERVSMSVSGHRTRSVFDRYNVVNEDDLRRAAELQEAYLAGGR